MCLKPETTKKLHKIDLGELKCPNLANVKGKHIL